MEQLFIQLIIMIVYIFIGVCLRKRRSIPDNSEEVLSAIVVSVMVPCTIISSFANVSINISLADILATVVLALVMFALLAIVGKLSARMLSLSKQEEGLWEFLVIFSNNIFIGFPIIEAMAGPQALVYASVVCIPCNTLIFSYGLYLISKGGSDFRFRINNICNPCTITSTLCIILLFSSVRIPEPVVRVINTLGNMSTPISLIVLGILIADTFRVSVFKERGMYHYCFMRLIVAPAITIIVLHPFFERYAQICQVLIITSALPASNMAVVLSEKYQNNVEKATTYVMMSTIFFIIFWPLMSRLLDFYFAL